MRQKTLAQTQEPVAYLTRRKIGGTEGLLRADMVDKSAKNQETHDFIPLYKDPKPCPTCEALARTVMLDQTSHDIPPQRTEERNFCSRCGKRTKDLTTIHTCTPPQD